MCTNFCVSKQLMLGHSTIATIKKGARYFHIVTIMSLGQQISYISTRWVNHAGQIFPMSCSRGRCCTTVFPLSTSDYILWKHARSRRQTLHFVVGFLRAWPLPSTQTQYVIVHKLITAAYSRSHHSWLYVVLSDESILRENKFQTWNRIFSVIFLFFCNSSRMHNNQMSCKAPRPTRSSASDWSHIYTSGQ